MIIHRSYCVESAFLCSYVPSNPWQETAQPTRNWKQSRENVLGESQWQQFCMRAEWRDRDLSSNKSGSNGSVLLNAIPLLFTAICSFHSGAVLVILPVIISVISYFDDWKAVMYQIVSWIIQSFLWASRGCHAVVTKFHRFFFCRMVFYLFTAAANRGFAYLSCQLWWDGRLLGVRMFYKLRMVASNFSVPSPADTVWKGLYSCKALKDLWHNSIHNSLPIIEVTDNRNEILIVN